MFEPSINRYDVTSLFEKGEHEITFGGDSVVHDAAAMSFGDAIASGFDQLGLNEESVARKNWLTEFYRIRAHKVADSVRCFRQFEKQNAGDLRHRLNLHDARHYGVAGKVSMKIRLVDRDRLHYGALGLN